MIPVEEADAGRAPAKLLGEARAATPREACKARRRRLFQQIGRLPDGVGVA